MPLWRILAVLLVLVALSVGSARSVMAEPCDAHQPGPHVAASAVDGSASDAACCVGATCAICAPVPVEGAFLRSFSRAGQAPRAPDEVALAGLADEPTGHPPRLG